MIPGRWATPLFKLRRTSYTTLVGNLPKRELEVGKMTPRQELATHVVYRNHKRSTGHFRNAKCHRCGKKWAYSGSGKCSPPDEPPGKDLFEMDESSDDQSQRSPDESDVYGMYALRSPANLPIQLHVTLNGAMELDTGASRTIISEATYRKL